MKKTNNTVEVFFELLRAGLWERSTRISSYSPIDFEGIFQLAEEQSVVGLIAAGLEHVSDVKVTKQQALPFLKKVFSLENRNFAMNSFISRMVETMQQAGIYSVLVKGQGVAQCYTRPQWRSAGDIDFFFDESNYERAKLLLIPKADSISSEDKRKKHLGMDFGQWVVEIHGLMPTEISTRVNAGIKEVQDDIFYNGCVRAWHNEGVDVFLPAPNDDVIIIFTHFLQHFFVGGVGLRQISDWSRLIWTYREEIDRSLLEHRLRKMGILSEWKAFACFAVLYLGIPADSMPLFSSSNSHKFKSNKICRVILNSGNFGQNKDQSYRHKYPKLIEKSITLLRRFGEFIRLSLIFPLDGPRFFLTYVYRRTKASI